MAVRLRLRRMGRKKTPFYRIVAADQRSPRNGRFIEILGYYNPLQVPHNIELKEERVLYWLSQGAQPSDTVKSLLRQKGILLKLELRNRGVEEEKIEEEFKRWELLQSERRKRHQAAALKAKKEKAEAATKEQVEEVEDISIAEPEGAGEEKKDEKAEEKAIAEPEQIAEEENKEGLEKAQEEKISEKVDEKGMAEEEALVEEKTGEEDEDQQEKAENSVEEESPEQADAEKTK